MFTILYQYLLVAGLAALKVIPAAVMGAGFELGALENALVLFAGGMLGVALYTFFGQRIRAWSKHRRRKKSNYGEKVQKNYRKARRIKRLWNRFGLVGIAFLTPPMLSPPVGTLIVVGFGESPRRILIYMGVSMAVWTLLFGFLGDTITGLFH